MAELLRNVKTDFFAKFDRVFLRASSVRAELCSCEFARLLEIRQGTSLHHPKVWEVKFRMRCQSKRELSKSTSTVVLLEPGENTCFWFSAHNNLCVAFLSLITELAQFFFDKGTKGAVSPFMTLRTRKKLYQTKAACNPLSLFNLQNSPIDFTELTLLRWTFTSS